MLSAASDLHLAGLEIAGRIGEPRAIALALAGALAGVERHASGCSVRLLRAASAVASRRRCRTPNAAMSIASPARYGNRLVRGPLLRRAAPVDACTPGRRQVPVPEPCPS